MLHQSALPFSWRESGPCVGTLSGRASVFGSVCLHHPHLDCSHMHLTLAQTGSRSLHVSGLALQRSCSLLTILVDKWWLSRGAEDWEFYQAKSGGNTPWELGSAPGQQQGGGLVRGTWGICGLRDCLLMVWQLPAEPTEERSFCSPWWGCTVERVRSRARVGGWMCLSQGIWGKAGS